jgi:chromosome segregation ATPase
MQFRRVAALLALAFGFLGVVACLAGIYVVWLLGSRLEQANKTVFAMVDKGLASAQERVRGVQKRVQESKITSTEIAQRLRDWSARKAEERLVSQFEIESRAEKLAGYLHTADSWLETSIESVRGAQQVLELGNLVGVSVDPTSLEQVVEKLTSLRSTLQQTEETVDGIRKFAANMEGESEENRLSRVTKLVARILLTISELDTRLEEPVTRLSELQTDARQLQARTSNYILLTTIGCYLLLAWIAAGQAALFLCGWKNCCGSRSSTKQIGQDET